MSTEYLVPSANDMHRLLSKDAPTPNDLASAASIGCSTLRRLVDDTQFRRNTEDLAQKWFMNRNTVKEIINDVEHFTYFLEMEKQLMVEEGLEPLLVNEVLRQGANAVKSNKWQGDIETLFIIIAKARDEACDLASSLTQNVRRIESGQERRRQRRTILLRITYAVAGGAIIVINTVAAAGVSPVLTIVGAALSGGIGSALMGQAIPAPDRGAELRMEEDF